MVYLDNNATTQPDPEVVDAMRPFFDTLWGNPSSVHEFGAQVRGHLDAARAQVAALIGADATEIVFTGCGTESNNMVLSRALEIDQGPERVITTAVEHSCVLEPCKRLEKAGVSVSRLGVDTNGLPDTDRLSSLLDRPALLSMMWANNETGVVMPVAAAATQVKAAGGWVHTDAIQAAGKVPIDVKASNVDFLSLSGHKLYAPKGVGALFVRRGIRLPALLSGGHHENGFRGGTENVASIVGFGKACELAKARLEEDARRVTELRDRFQRGVLELSPDARVNGGEVDRLPNTLSVSFKGRESDSLLFALSDAGVAAAAGATCSTGVMEVSHVIRAMKVPRAYEAGTLRFSLGRKTTSVEVDEALRILADVLG